MTALTCAGVFGSQAASARMQMALDVVLGLALERREERGAGLRHSDPLERDDHAVAELRRLRLEELEQHRERLGVPLGPHRVDGLDAPLLVDAVGGLLDQEPDDPRIVEPRELLEPLEALDRVVVVRLREHPFDVLTRGLLRLVRLLRIVESEREPHLLEELGGREHPDVAEEDRLAVGLQEDELRGGNLGRLEEGRLGPHLNALVSGAGVRSEARAHAFVDDGCVDPDGSDEAVEAPRRLDDVLVVEVLFHDLVVGRLVVHDERDHDRLLVGLRGLEGFVEVRLPGNRGLLGCTDGDQQEEQNEDASGSAALHGFSSTAETDRSPRSTGR